MKKNKFKIAIVTCIIIIVSLTSISQGTANIGVIDTFNILLSKLMGDKLFITSKTSNIIWNLRVPRTILALIAGGGLAISGVAMQATVQNIMAEPYLFGVASGATAAIAISYSFGSIFITSQRMMTLVAFCGSILAMLLVFFVSGSRGKANMNKMILAGICMSVLFTSITHFFIIFNKSERGVRSIMTWTLGSLQTARWNNILYPILGTTLGLIVFIFLSRAFDAMSIGDDAAISLGINIESIRKIAIVMVSIVTGSIVALTGVIGFVGFIVPHIGRKIVGSGHRSLFPFCFLFGSLFMVIVDILARILLAPVELPIGIITSIIGVPFFIYLIKRGVN